MKAHTHTGLGNCVMCGRDVNWVVRPPVLQDPRLLPIAWEKRLPGATESVSDSGQSSNEDIHFAGLDAAQTADVEVGQFCQFFLSHP